MEDIEAMESPDCDDQDCQFNVYGVCFHISTIIHNIPGGMYTCSNAINEYIEK